MFNLFRRNCLYNASIEPHCAYCAHCKPDNAYQGVCDYRGIVAMAGSCRRFEYDALRRRPPKPARIRGRFTDADFFFEEKEADESTDLTRESQTPIPPHKPLISDDLSQFADLWEDEEDDSMSAAETTAAASDTEEESPEAPEDKQEEDHEM
ncbi:MAG: hypothetical protein Q4D42_03435 [Eubacteriales bacterium]|nr:hypothetical protein [Eubacteriales bacterium]